MKVLLLLAVVILAFGPIQVQGSLLQFADMITLKTGNIPLLYFYYGCQCQLLPSGPPKDGTDRCCLAHKCCLEPLEKRRCSTKFMLYKFIYEGGEIICPAKQRPCATELCQCDKAAADCFAQNVNTYNKTYFGYPERLCTGPSPGC